MSRLLRLFCVCLGVTIVAALQAHGAINTGHRIEHSLDFPGVAYADAAAVDHDHHEPDHQATDSEPPEYGAIADTGGDERPFHHHHHGGDIQLALLAPAALLPVNPVLSANPGPAHDALPPSLSDDGPSRPPKHLRLIA